MTSSTTPISADKEPSYQRRRPVKAVFETLGMLFKHAFIIPDVIDAYKERGDRAEQEIKQLRTLVETDALTKLPNRGAFDKQFKKAIAEANRYDIPVALIMIDVDNFKKGVNDKYGHQAGDEVLKTVGDVLNRHHRTEDTVARLRTGNGAEVKSGPMKHPARYGGEEFALVLIGCSLENATIIAQEIRHDVETARTKLPAAIDGQTHLEVTTSLGVAAYDKERDDDSGANLLRRADVALYEAKNNGKNIVYVSSPIGPQRVEREVPVARQTREVSSLGDTLSIMPKPSNGLESKFQA